MKVPDKNLSLPPQKAVIVLLHSSINNWCTLVYIKFMSSFFNDHNNFSQEVYISLAF